VGVISRRTMVALAVAGSLAAAGAIAASSGVVAQDSFPNRPITLVVPFAAGGSTDVVARLLAEQMSIGLGQQLVVENRAGGGGNVGAAAVSKADPDGYTILMATVATHALNPLIAKTRPYDPLADFAPVSLLAVVPNVLVVNPEFPAKDVKGLIALLKAEPGKYNYASSGVGTPLHLSGELFKTLSGTQMTHIPYRGSGPALIDVVAGRVPIMFDNLPSASEFIRAGTLRALAVTTKTRASSFPDVPTMSEAGLEGYETYTWNALFAPKGTPAAVVARLNTAANKALADPALQSKFKAFSAGIVGSTPEALTEHVKAELAKWEPVVTKAGIRLE
jgi:tripartite-type tricarboxylate transporter receptor subunit TctC